jgi:hypothetical protein
MSSTQCDVCGNALEDQSSKLCASCRQKAAFEAEKPPSRGNVPCRCGGRSFVRAQMRERTYYTTGSVGDDLIVPLAITYAQGEEYKGVFSLKKIPSATPDFGKPQGRLYTFVCRACGLVEWVAASPENIPISAACGTELVEIPEEPYR